MKEYVIECFRDCPLGDVVSAMEMKRGGEKGPLVLTIKPNNDHIIEVVGAFKSGGCNSESVQALSDALSLAAR